MAFDDLLIKCDM